MLLLTGYVQVAPPIYRYWPAWPTTGRARSNRRRRTRIRTAAYQHACRQYKHPNNRSITSSIVISRININHSASSSLQVVSC